ncbi:MAG TPA: peptidase M48 [Deltaproteobacteria bacterium]|nr:MAG: peptidase M48 [Deltaproteobacteria bacterium GWA2_55_82]OGQ64903.1 MAG: peptidase M48 [Deltaproteobacteria bacterium RIFCSPLOWO2_02_FULL_55_12]OIJ73971.1 MAG: peptidase M48 [Deltaproteobacteria bacterium GWC2_55_46]HBG46571.1 peptidase M48 [Deltaproteobacteria bacterium]HCY09973.1 peptidase M48 [Deltaproteobacteria bacterium]
MEYSLAIIISLFVAAAGFGYALEALNLRHLRKKGANVPRGFEGHIDQAFLERSRDYTVEQTRFSIAESIAGNAITLVFVLLLLEPYDRWVASFGAGFVTSGLLFFVLILFAQTLIGAPWGLYRTFRIEKKYGFSQMTSRLWIADLAKALAISTAMTALLVSAGLWIVKASPGLWWFWVWCLFLGATVFMMYISPYVIEPLFNRFEEVDDPGLEEGIRSVMEKAGIRVRRVQKIDASRRTAHTNAYFTGIGKVKRIVLYDTLMEKLEGPEIISVLAHETGHWRGRHLLKTLLLIEAISLAALYLSYAAISSGLLERAFGFEGASFYAQAVMLGFLAPVAAFPLGPLLAWVSRRHEREADDYALRVSGDPGAVASALVKLTRDNLSNLYPHPLYAAFYYSHPPMAERVRRIRESEERGFRRI